MMNEVAAVIVDSEWRESAENTPARGLKASTLHAWRDLQQSLTKHGPGGRGGGGGSTAPLTDAESGPTGTAATSSVTHELERNMLWRGGYLYRMLRKVYFGVLWGLTFFLLYQTMVSYQDPSPGQPATDSPGKIYYWRGTFREGSTAYISHNRMGVIRLF